MATVTGIENFDFEADAKALREALKGLSEFFLLHYAFINNFYYSSIWIDLIK